VSSLTQTPHNLITEVSRHVTPELCKNCFDHMLQFLPVCLRKIDINLDEMYEKSYEGDEQFSMFEELRVPEVDEEEEGENGPSSIC
jgi:hypothetical protein